MRALVKLTLGHGLATTLASDIAQACETLEKKGGLHELAAMRIAVSRAPGAERVVTRSSCSSTSSTSSRSGSSRTTCSSTSICAPAPRR